MELATMGDLKLVERPQSLTIGPLDQRQIRANIKVSSTETGHIFGNLQRPLNFLTKATRRARADSAGSCGHTIDQNCFVKKTQRLCVALDRSRDSRRVGFRAPGTVLFPLGTIVYEKANSSEKHCINLNNIHLDIMDYIRPATCNKAACERGKQIVPKDTFFRTKT